MNLNKKNISYGTLAAAAAVTMSQSVQAHPITMFTGGAEYPTEEARSIYGNEIFQHALGADGFYYQHAAQQTACNTTFKTGQLSMDDPEHIRDCIRAYSNNGQAPVMFVVEADLPTFEQPHIGNPLNAQAKMYTVEPYLDDQNNIQYEVVETRLGNAATSMDSDDNPGVYSVDAVHNTTPSYMNGLFVQFRNASQENVSAGNDKQYGLHGYPDIGQYGGSTGRCIRIGMNEATIALDKLAEVEQKYRAVGLELSDDWKESIAFVISNINLYNQHTQSTSLESDSYFSDLLEDTYARIQEQQFITSR